VAESGNVESRAFEIDDAYRIIGSNSQRRFWAFAARDIVSGSIPKGPPRAHGSSYDSMCAAVEDVERKKSANRLGASFVPRTPRRLSTDDLQKAILRARERLFASEFAKRPLTVAYSSWVQAEFSKPLVATLQALGCHCDERGTLIGEIQNTDSKLATERLTALSESFDVANLIVACSGLIVDSPKWEFLRSALDYLIKNSIQDAAANASKATEVDRQIANVPVPAVLPLQDLQLDFTNLDRTAKAPTDDSDLRVSDPQKENSAGHQLILSRLRTEMLSLGHQLGVVGEKLKSGVYIAPAGIMKDWLAIAQGFEAVRENLLPSAVSLDDIEDVLSKKSERLACAELLSKLRFISLRSGVATDDLEQTRRIVADLQAGLRSDDLSPHDAKVRGAIALLRLVDGLEPHAAEDPYADFSQASEVFGPKIAFDASQGKFLVHEGNNPGSEQFADYKIIASQESTSDIQTSNIQTDRVTSSPEDLVESRAIGVSAELKPQLEERDISHLEFASNSPPVHAQPDARPETSASSEEVFKGKAGESIEVRPPAANSTQVATRSGSENFEPDTLCNFAEFCEKHWIDAEGNAGPAPWTKPDFMSKLSESANASWDRTNQWQALLLSTAAAAEGLPSEIDINELGLVSRLLDNPAGYVPQRQVGRIKRLKASHSSKKRRTDSVSLTLEALAPTLPFQLSSAEVDLLVAQVGYDAPSLATIVRFLLLGWSAATDPVQLLRLQHSQLGVDDPVALQASLKSSQKRMQEIVTALYSAAGGRIQQRHCRKAWTEFITRHVVPLRQQLAPLPNERSKNEINASKATQMAVELLRAFKRTMDAEQVKHQDLAAAVSAAEQIVSAIQNIVDAKSKIDQLTRKPPKSIGTIPVDELSQLITDLPSGGADRLCALAVRAALTRTPQPNPLLIPVGLLIEHPDLVRMVNRDAISSPNLHIGIRVNDITDLRGAVATLGNTQEHEIVDVDSTSTLLTILRDRAVDLGRIDLLSALSSTDVLQSHERTQLHRRSLEVGDEAYDLARRLEKYWLDCDELVHPEASGYRDVARDALRQCADSAEDLNPSRGLLLVQWLRSQIRVVSLGLESIIHTRIRQASERGRAIAIEFEKLARSGNHRSAMALLNPATAAVESEFGTVRKTIWRRDAVEIFNKPTLTLTKELKGSNPDQGLLVSSWAEAAANPTFPDRDSIRKAFYAVISGEAGRSQAENQRRFAVKLTELRDHPHRKTIVTCSAIREYFKRARLNPTFLPQLADYRQIVIVSSGIGQPGNALDVISRSVAQEGAGTLCVFLEPGLSIPKRDELCIGLRKRNLPAAVIDDVDACRLCSIVNDVEAHNFIPFLEIVFEQLDLEMVSPFSGLDGQHVRMETFIGRGQQANRIANTSDFTRIFSGRKLGKSAFLRYVTHTYDGAKLPSGNTLNVIFITIAGGESEAWVVDCIINEMANRFQLLGEMEQSTRLRPPDRFTRYTERFMKAKPSENVLLVLDEADAFVEGQLRTYDTDREGSLSFRMMKELPARVDAAGMPRIRIVFSGYRVTNTRGGVWANAGDVLILKPLTEDEAVEFLGGMLGRVGLKIGSHAPFAARRCGYQPAVLIRFGESLLRRIKRSARSLREGYVVSYEDVLATMNDQSVMDEIRTVVTNNFQGNRAAAAIFGATLLALKDLEPGMSLDEGPNQVLAKIAEIDPNLDWLARYGPQPLSQVERQLQEFIDRELLTVSDAPRFGVRQYRLRFPHFLPVLTQQSEVANEVRVHIRHLRAEGQSRQYIESILSEASLDEARFWHRQEDTEGCSLVVIGSQWAAPLTDRKVGIPDRLGCNPPSVTRINDGSTYVDQVHGRQVFTNVSQQNWSLFVSISHARPLTLIGGIDLQRCARADFFSDAPHAIEPLRVGRIPESTVAWWFQVGRALHFVAANAVQRIWESTAGVPILVGALDELLVGTLGSEVSEQELHLALRRLDEQLPNLAQQLIDGPSAVRLSHRELELLRMAHHVAKEVEPSFDLGNEFLGHWELCADALTKGWRAPMTDKDDNVALLVLMDAGLLAQPTQVPPKGASALGRVEIITDGVVGRLVDLMGSQVGT
jgi:hypothetical protein